MELAGESGGVVEGKVIGSDISAILFKEKRQGSTHHLAVGIL
jgi:hypothetical protein